MKDYGSTVFKIKYLFASMVLLCCISISCQKEVLATITVRWELLSNTNSVEGIVHDARFTIVNTSNFDLNDQNWALYWNQVPRNIIDTYGDSLLNIRHVNGDFYELKPKKGFFLKKGDSTAITILANYFMIKISDAPTGMYMVDDKEQSDPVDLSIKAFERPSQLNRGVQDAEPLATPQYIFRSTEDLSILNKKERYPFIPSPQYWMPKEDTTIVLPEIVKLYADDHYPNVIQYLSKSFTKEIIKTENKAEAHIVLSRSTTLSIPSSYTLNIPSNASQIKIEGADATGIFYGAVSLSQLPTNDGQIPSCSIQDAPAYGYRGMHLDVARNFQSKATVKRLMEVMARGKLNKLLLVLTEDEAWRLDIAAFPELVQVASKRGHTLRETDFLQPAYGSGPNPHDSASNGNGFYTRDDFKELLQYAQQLHIDIIPVVNFPGHARAAIKAMENRYERLLDEGDTLAAEQYRLIDPNDSSKYLSAQFYKDNVACVCQPAVYDFYEVVWNDIQKMYEEANVSLTMIHTGGDEVPRGAWAGSPICKAYMQAHPTIQTPRNLQIHFFNELTKRLAITSLDIGGWEEIVMQFDENDNSVISDAFANGKVYPYIWNNLWGAQDLGYRIANKGYPVILCNVTNLYFDLAYNKDPREPGLYWGGFNDEEDAFSFLPENLFLSTTEDQMGRAFNPKNDFVGQERLNPNLKKNIIGLQAQLWGETIYGGEMLEYYYLPKIYGLAQRAWQGTPSWGNIENESVRTQARRRDYNQFINTVVQQEFPWLDKQAKPYTYRIPAPGIILEKGWYHLSSPYPGMDIRYTLDGTEPTINSSLYRTPIEAMNRAIKAKVFNKWGRSGLVSEWK